MLFAKALILLLAGGSLGAVVASVAEKEASLITGPAVGAVALVLAILAYRARRTATFFYALLGPTVYVGCAAMSGMMHWSQYEAKRPVAVVLAVWALLQISISPLAMIQWRARGGAARLANNASGAIAPQEFPPARLQLSLRWLMLLVLLSTVPMGTYTLAGVHASIVAAAGVYALLVLLSVRAFYRNALPAGEIAAGERGP